MAIKGEGNLIFRMVTSHWQRKFNPIIKDNEAIIFSIFTYKYLFLIILPDRFYLIFTF
jgi:hypothetical protein